MPAVSFHPGQPWAGVYSGPLNQVARGRQGEETRRFGGHNSEQGGDSEQSKELRSYSLFVKGNGRQRG